MTCCAEAVRADTAGGEGGGARFAAPAVLAEALLARVDDSQDEVRVEALNGLAVLLGLRLDRDVVDKVQERVTVLLKEEEEELTREAAQSLLVALAAA